MALIIEDGTGVVGATSYVTVAEARSYASAHGDTLPAGDSDVEKLLLKAKDYLETFRNRYQGFKMYGRGYLQWPRSMVIVDGYYLGEDEIPQELKDAQCQVAIEFQTVDPLAAQSAAAVRKEKVGPIETEYAVSADSRPSITMPRVDALLAPLLNTTGGLSTLRI